MGKKRRNKSQVSIENKIEVGDSNVEYDSNGIHDLLIGYFTTIPTHLICEYARKWSGKLKRTRNLKHGIIELVKGSSNIILFKKPNSQKIYQLDLFQTQSITTLFCKDILCFEEEETCEMWKQNQLVDYHLMTTSDYVIQWTKFNVLIHNKLNSTNDYVHGLTVDPLNPLVHCFPLVNNQFVVGTTVGLIGVYDMVKEDNCVLVAQWLARVQPIVTGCYIAPSIFAVGYRRIDTVDIWKNAQRLQSITCGGSVTSMNSLNNQLFIVSVDTLAPSEHPKLTWVEIWEVFHQYKKSRFICASNIYPSSLIDSISIASNRIAFVCENGSVQVWDGKQCQPMATLMHREAIRISMSHDSQPIQKCLWLDNEYLVTMSGNEVRLWE